MIHLLRDAPVLFYMVHYLLASILVFQGVQQLEEQRAPFGFLPQEVVQKPAFHVFWGWTLTGLGCFALALGLLSHGVAGAAPLLVPVVWVELVAVSVFGFSLVFLGRKVQYIGKPTVTADGGHH